jgi:hypothetical protein
MKWRAAMICFLLLGLSARAQLVLNPGESYSLRFETLWFEVYFPGLPQQGGYVVHFQPLEPQGVVRCEVWEGEMTGSPVHTGQIGGDSWDFFTITNLWNDLEGTVRLTALNGPVSVSYLYIGVYADRFGGPECDMTCGDEFYLEPRPPALEISTITNAVSLSWWTNTSVGYVLESSTDLSGTVWSLVTNASCVVEKKHFLTLSSTANTARFFRLRR